MEQLELELGLVPMQKWLHVWDEAARKKARAEAQARPGRIPVGEEGKEEENIKQLSCAGSTCRAKQAGRP